MLALAGSSALGLSLGISAAIVVLMLAVGPSYRQLIMAYPLRPADRLRAHRGCVDLRRSSGDHVGHPRPQSRQGRAGAADRDPPGRNLRGVREAGALFSAPTYAFVLGIAMLVAVGLVDRLHDRCHADANQHGRTDRGTHGAVGATRLLLRRRATTASGDRSSRREMSAMGSWSA